MLRLCIVIATHVVLGFRTSDIDTFTTEVSLEPVHSLANLGVPKTWAAAILAGDSWAANAGVTFRVMDEAGVEQEFNGRFLRTMDELLSAGAEVDGYFLVIPNRNSSKQLASVQAAGRIEFIDVLEGTKLETLERDAAKDYGNHFLYLLGVRKTGLQRAYKLGHKGSALKLTLADGGPVPQAMFSVHRYTSVLKMVQSLFETNPAARDLAKSNDYPVIAHIASVLARGAGSGLDDFKDQFEDQAGFWRGIGKSEPNENIAGDVVAVVAEKYRALDGKFRVDHHTTLKTHRNVVRAVIAAAGTSSAKVRDAGDGQAELLEEKTLKLETQSVQKFKSIGEGAEALLAGSSWAKNAGAEFRVINGEGKEVEFDGTVYRTLPDILKAGHLLDGQYLVVPNRAARKELQRSTSVTLTGWTSIDILEKDCGRSKPTRKLARAYRIAHDFYDPSKFCLEDGAPLAQAVFLLAEDFLVGQ